MPIAERRPPIVVGMRQTRSAASEVSATGVPRPAAATACSENGRSVATTTRKTSVSATRRMCSAISFGVRRRFAPSTIAIIRSRKVEPGSEVIRTTSQSERTRVPPVTALRSPPLSRMTGALSPVTALSSTLAAPSTTSPSPGIVSPAETSANMPMRSSVEGRERRGPLRSGPSSTVAVTSRRVRRSASAWARPRPSASASARFAK